MTCIPKKLITTLQTHSNCPNFSSKYTVISQIFRDRFFMHGWPQTALGRTTWDKDLALQQEQAQVKHNRHFDYLPDSCHPQNKHVFSSCYKLPQMAHQLQRIKDNIHLHIEIMTHKKMPLYSLDTTPFGAVGHASSQQVACSWQSVYYPE